MNTYLWIFPDQVHQEKMTGEPDSDALESVSEDGDGALLRFNEEKKRFEQAEIKKTSEPENVNDPDTDMIDTYEIDGWNSV